MIDPERPMRVSYKRSLTIDNFPASLPVTGGLVRALQIVAAHADSHSGNQDWRLDAYRTIFDSLFDTTHMGTGSEAEKEMHKALDIIAQVLCVESAG